jgi:hypothetical protein
MHPKRSVRNWLFENIVHVGGRVLLICAILLIIISSAMNDVYTQRHAYAMAEATPNSPFGVELYPVNIDGGLLEIQATQTKFTRGAQVIWKDIESIPGQYDWSKLNQTIQAIQNLQTVSGAEPIVVVRGTPGWAQKYAPYSCGPIYKDNVVNYFVSFGNFMQAVIGRLDQQGITIKYWEIWNEPDIPRQYVSNPDNFWGGCWGEIGDPYYGGGYYGEMLKVVYPKIKAADPNAIVLIGGLLLDCDPNNPPVDPNNPPNLKDCSSGKFLEGIILAGAGNAFDGVAFHAFDYYQEYQLSPTETIGTYENANWPSSGWNKEGPVIISKARFIKSILSKYGISNKILVTTENSLLDCAFCTNTNPYPPLLEATKANYVAQVYAASLAEGLKATIWFDMTGSWLRNNGLVKNGSPVDKLPAYYAYQFAASYLVGAQLDHQVQEFDGVAGYEFKIDATKHIWVLWSHDGQPHTVHFFTPPTAATDVFGNDKTVPNSISYVVTLQPTYFETPALIIRNVIPKVANNFPYVLSLGGFETGLDGWTLINGGLPASRITTHPNDPRTNTQDLTIPSGIGSILLGNPSSASCPGVPVGYAAIQKQITIPAIPQGHTMTLNLSFDYVIYTEDGSSSITYDRFEVYIGNNTIPSFFDGYRPGFSGACHQWKRIPSPQVPSINGQTSGWAHGTIDVSSYWGQTIQVSFRNYNRFDGYYNTYTYIDNIQLLVGP